MHSHLAKASMMEYNGRKWQDASGPFDVTVGKNGLAAAKYKREGDRRTPMGIYPLGAVFGYTSFIKTRMPYIQATSECYWVDDPCSSEYNRWVKGKPSRASGERMKRRDHFYKLGIIVEYNTHRTMKGRGSAIFVHIWRRPGCVTGGCVAMSEKNLRKVVKWLKPQFNPMILIDCAQ